MSNFSALNRPYLGWKGRNNRHCFTVQRNEFQFIAFMLAMHEDDHPYIACF